MQTQQPLHRQGQPLPRRSRKFRLRVRSGAAGGGSHSHHTAHGAAVAQDGDAQAVVALQQAPQSLQRQHEQLGGAARVHVTWPHAPRLLVLRQCVLSRPHHHLLLIQQQRRLRAQVVPCHQHAQRHASRQGVQRVSLQRVSFATRLRRRPGGGGSRRLIRQLQRARQHHEQPIHQCPLQKPKRPGTRVRVEEKATAPACLLEARMDRLSRFTLQKWVDAELVAVGFECGPEG